MDKREQFKQFISQRSIVDHNPVQITNHGLSHEVFNPKGKHFLEFKHFVEDSNAPTGLSTVTRTTHGFKLTRKGALYLPKELKDSVPSLLEPYAVPVKPKHRDLSGSSDVDPIGRVTGGRYVDDFGVRNPTFSINDSIGGDHRNPNAMKAIRDALKSKVLLDGNFRGLGYMIVDGVVYDPSAIEKILDGRYLTVSVEMTPSDWINPLTGNSWEDDIGEVDYYPGDVVDGIPAIMVAGSLKQEGYAYTTHPADVYAATLQHGRSEILDSIVERSKTPMFLIDKNMGDRLSSIFDGIMLGKNEFVMDSTFENETNTTGNPANSHPGDENRGNTDSDSSIVVNDNSGEAMKVEEIITLLKEDKDALQAVLDSDLGLVSKEAVTVAEAKVAELEKAVSDSRDSVNLVRIYKEQLQTSMLEGVEAKAALDSAVRDHRETLAQFEFLAKLVTDQDNVPEGPVLEKDKTLSEVQDSVSQLVGKFDATSARQKLFGLAKNVEDTTGVEDPTKVVGDNSPTTKVEDSASFSANEVSVATRYGEKLKAGKRGEAAGYLARMRRSGVVADSFDPNIVLKAISGETK